MKHIFLLVISFVFSMEVFASGALPECRFAGSAAIILEEGDSSVLKSRLLQSWEVDNTDNLFSNSLPSSDSFSEILNTVIDSVWSTRQSFLLRKIIGSDLPNADILNARRTLAHKRKLVRPTQCIEAFLLSQQTDRIDMISTPTEFTAFILRSNDNNRLRIYYYTTNEPGIRNMGAVTSLVEKDVKSGIWQLWVNLHNHNFNLFDNTKPLNGVVAPSATDIEFFRNLASELGLREAWITNGFDTSVISSRDFWKFHVAKKAEE